MYSPKVVGNSEKNELLVFSAGLQHSEVRNWLVANTPGYVVSNAGIAQNIHHYGWGMDVIIISGSSMSTGLSCKRKVIPVRDLELYAIPCCGYWSLITKNLLEQLNPAVAGKAKPATFVPSADDSIDEGYFAVMEDGKDLAIVNTLFEAGLADRYM